MFAHLCPPITACSHHIRCRTIDNGASFIYNDASLFVQNANGDIVSPIAIIASMHSVLELAGIVLEKAHCTHVLRHTFASMCFAARIPVKTVSEMLGHSSVQITMDIYIHLIQENGVPLVPEIKAMV